jgi:predicted pyridoxine 5'-phosphate oxidase superfamily flavin-nucleotide-binding protein
VRLEADQVGRGIRSTVPPAMARVLGDFGLAVAASRDEAGRVWASLLVGSPGFIRTVDEQLVFMAAQPRPGDPLARNLGHGPELGLLVIDLATRRRLRLNGRALLDPAQGIFLSVEQAYGNCPRYIHQLTLEPLPMDQPMPAPKRSGTLSPPQRALISSAGTFFIASAHPEGGADASHRGGAPGFVRVLDDKTLAFPDYPGNNMFNTLGNLAVEPRAGLLFLDFETGSMLQLTGRTRLDWTGANAVVRFEVGEALELRGVGVRTISSRSAGHRHLDFGSGRIGGRALEEVDVAVAAVKER